MAGLGLLRQVTTKSRNSRTAPSLFPAVVITGASTGIGKACAIELDRRGFHVFAGVRTDAAAEQLRAAASSRLTPLLIDVTVGDTIAAAAKKVCGGQQGTSGLRAWSTTPASPFPAPSNWCRSTTSAANSKST